MLTRYTVSLAVILSALCAPCLAQEPEVLRFEAEDISEPADAWRADEESEDRWNLWSTDTDAEEKWSEGIVLQSPRVMEDRERPEDGAPPLHSTVTGIPPGRWEVRIGGVGRPVAISLDGETWRRQTGRIVGEFEIEDGRFELWVDDRFADETNPGWCYYDYLELVPALETVNGVKNGGFEETRGAEEVPGWGWWSREGVGGCSLSDEAHAGEHSALIEHPGERDFAFSCTGRFSVPPGDRLTARAWIRAEGDGNVGVAIVAMHQGEVVQWNIGHAVVDAPTDWTLVEAPARLRGKVDEVYVRVTGIGDVRAWVDEVTLDEGWPEPTRRADRPPVQGWAEERVEERLDRGLVAMPLEGGRVYLGWRLLERDPEGVGFEVFRRAGEQGLRKLTDEPITRTCDFIDEEPVPGVENAYAVKAVAPGSEGETSRPVTVTPAEEPAPYIAMPLQGEYTFQKAGIADLDGDGAYDFVIKQPNANVDPYEGYWYPSPESFKLEAYRSDGTFLWRRDLGLNIERGIWYSPYIVWDLDGDGRAEVAVKTAPTDEDYRDETGRVTSGPEYLSILDGMTGEELDRVPWPSREEFPTYNYASRNLMCVAYLDGRTPCVVVDRGTYNVMIVEAYQFHDGKLEQLWRWRDTDDGALYRGQGAHSMHAVDVDGDGRDEVFLGSAVLDDTGVGLWSTGMGHPDHHYVGDIDPTRPGLEVYYGMETGQPADGCSLWDAATGEWLWGLDERTHHVHASGMCADIDPRYPGMECYSGERDYDEQRWLWSAQGELIEKTNVGGLSPRTVYWDADPQRELIHGDRIEDFRGGVHFEQLEGRVMGFADLLGDWREELIVTVEGELRIYTTTIPAEDRRVCLMQDPIYRRDVAIQAMGYTQCPMMTECISADEANMAIMLEGRTAPVGEKTMAELVLTAPVDEALSGTAQLSSQAPVALGKTVIDVQVPAGEVGRFPFGVTFRRVEDDPVRMALTGGRQIVARYEGAGGPLSAMALVRPLDEPLTDLPRVQAEQIDDEGGGEVQIRDDKVAADGLCFSHWDDEGHWLQWRFTVPEDGRYRLIARYCCQDDARRLPAIDGEELAPVTFDASGGFSGERNEWRHGAMAEAALGAGEHTLRMTNLGGNGMNLDYVLVLPTD